jgi:hypothetical protein
MATPAGFEAAPPVTATAGATAVPVGWFGLGGLFVGEVVGGLLVPLAGVTARLPGLSGSSIGGWVELSTGGLEGCCCPSKDWAVPVSRKVSR